MTVMATAIWALARTCRQWRMSCLNQSHLRLARCWMLLKIDRPGTHWLQHLSQCSLISLVSDAWLCRNNLHWVPLGLQVIIISAAGGSASSESDGMEEQIRPSILRTKAQCKAALKKLQKEGRRAERRESGFELDPPPATFVSTSLAFGEFEKHTRGIGSKLMADMGFKGQGRGLGPLQGGRAEPVTAFMRPKKLGLGAE